MKQNPLDVPVSLSLMSRTSKIGVDVNEASDWRI
jgi:hypothetical protein